MFSIKTLGRSKRSSKDLTRDLPQCDVKDRKYTFY